MREEIASLLIDSQANASEIQALHDESTEKNEKMEKLNLEVTVVVTEKAAMKKDFDRLQLLHTNLQLEHKEARSTYNLLVEENTKITKQNQNYRALILENESKMMQAAKQVKAI